MLLLPVLLEVYSYPSVAQKQALVVMGIRAKLQ